MDKKQYWEQMVPAWLKEGLATGDVVRVVVPERDDKRWCLDCNDVCEKCLNSDD